VEKVIALVDCNSFFCSCEQVFNPKSRNKPVIVLSNNDGCAVSRTDQAKALGIEMGIPYFKIRELCEKHGVFVFSSNYVLYGDMSNRVMETLSEFAPEMEVYSIDEAFLSFTGMEHVDLVEYGKKIVKTVYKHTGIPVSLGLGPTKVLAKAANKLAKKRKSETGGVFDLRSIDNQERYLKDFPVRDLWGIGKQSELKLKMYNIKSAWQLRNADLDMVQKLLSVNGKRIVLELNGESCIELEDQSEEKKQIISSRSFGQPIIKIADIKEALANHVTSAFERLRCQNSVVRSISIFVQTNPFKQLPQYFKSTTANLASGISATNGGIEIANCLLEDIFRDGYEYKKVGVMLNDIVPASEVQLDLFGKNEKKRDKSLMEVIDAINEKEGRGTVKFAACGIDKSWKMLSEMKSKAVTSRWEELVRVKMD